MWKTTIITTIIITITTTTTTTTASSSAVSLNPGSLEAGDQDPILQILKTSA